MMNFEFNQEHRIFKETIARFAQKEVAALVAQSEGQGCCPRELIEEGAKLGFTGTPYPDKYGGCGPDMIATCLVVEGISKVSASLGLAFLIQNSVGTAPIYYFGSEPLKQKYLAAAIRGEKVAAFALTEPGVGSDAASITCRAVRDGDHYIMNGTKMFISNSHISDFMVVAVRTDKDAPRGKGLTLLLVDRNDSPYVTYPLKKLGLHGLDTSEVVFEECRVPAENRIGEEGKGFQYLLHTLLSSRIVAGAAGLGVARAAFEAAVGYVQERVQFGRKLAEFQAIRHKLTDMCIETELAETMVYKAAWLFSQGRECDKEASICKVFASEVANRNAAEAVQIFGGYGYMQEYPVERYFRDAKAIMIFEGTSEIQRNVLAKLILAG